LSAGALTGALASTLCPRTVCFSPNHCDAPVVAALDAARDSLDVAVYGLNSPSITDAVLRAFARKVAVRVIVDRTQLGGHAMHVQIGRLIAAGIPVKRQHHAGIMHDKFVVVDDAMVETGSFNWTTRATDVNDENVLVLCDAALAGLFAERFIAMWAEDWEVEP
jgi:phosphatidylserine/phosphatidylglycerophosphate/cardiolipin synthase-like enzyme